MTSSQTSNPVYASLLVHDEKLYIVSVADTHLTATPVRDANGDPFTGSNSPSELRYNVDSLYAIRYNTQESLAFTLHLCPLVDASNQSASSHRQNQRLQFSFPPTFDESFVPSTQKDSLISPSDFYTRLHSTIESRFPPVQNHKLHVFLNPVSGPRQGREHWLNIVHPMLIARGYDEDNILLVETTGQGVARIEAEKIEFAEGITGQVAPVIICIGGDGIIHEVINGVAAAKAQADAAVGDRRLGKAKQEHRIKIGVIPAGTGNALATSLGIRGIDDAVFRIIRGQTQSLNTMRVTFGTSPSPSSPSWYDEIQWTNKPVAPMRLFVVFSWGFHAQVVSKSEWLRFLGNARFSWTAQWLLALLWQYEGVVRLGGGGWGVQKFDHSKLDFVDVPGGTVEVDDRFTYFLCTKQAELEPGFRIMPFARADDRWIDVLYFRNGTRGQLMETAVKAFQGGKHLGECEFLEYYKAREMVLKVKQGTEVCLDGEVVSVGKNGVVKVELVEGGDEDEEGLFEVLV